jgi:hypothetical protein
METSILIMIVIAIVLIYLIFKFIKKMIFAVISAILVVVLLFGGVIGIAVYDVKTLSEKTDFNVNLAYFNNAGDYVLGTTLPVVNSEVNQEGVSSLSESDFTNLDYKNLNKKGDEFVVKFDRTVLENIITSETYIPSFFESMELPEGTEFSLTKTQVLDLVESNDVSNQVLDILFETNGIDESLSNLIKPELTKALEEELSDFGVSLNEAILYDFLMVSVEANEIDFLETLSLYKDEKLEIYPNRLTFSLVKMLPSSFVQKQIESVSNSEPTVE